MRALLVLLMLSACPAEEKAGPAPKRFAAVKSTKRSARAAKIFCEKTYAAGAKKFRAPAAQPMPTPQKAAKAEGWRWINFWASWCGPCIEEFPLLERWRKALEKEGTDLTFELWTVDEEREALVKALQNPRQFPEGSMHWVRSPEDLGVTMDDLGLERGTAIPIHALVDPKGDLRCVRVGSVGANDYGTIRAIIGS